MPETPVTTELGWTKDENGLWYPPRPAGPRSRPRRRPEPEWVSVVVAVVALAVLLVGTSWLLLDPADPCDEARAEGLAGVQAC